MPSPPTPKEVRTVRAAIRRHLGLEALEVSKLRGGAGRRVYFVRLEDREVVLKVLGVHKARAVSCEFAAEGMRQAGVPTPRVLAVDRSGRYQGEFFEYPFLIMEKAEGMPLDQWLLESKEEPELCNKVLRRVGEALRKVHSVRTVSGWGRIDDQGVGRFDSWREFLDRHWLRRADGEAARVLDTEWLEREKLVRPAVRSRVDRLFGRRHGFRQSDDARLVHNDLTLKNIFIDPKQRRVAAILDLHNALAGDPALDLARFEYFYLDRGYYDSLREGYGQVPHDFERRSLHLLVFVLLEKLSWLRGREDRFPGRMEKDLALLEETMDMLA